MDHWNCGHSSSPIINGPERSCNCSEDDDECGGRGVENHGGGTAIRKEVAVAVVGNGPAAIFLSLLLSGYWPYFSGSHPDEFLTARLKANEGKSILEQDLDELSSGLEGRSSNPIALLVDALLRPEADIGGADQPSVAWEHHPEKAVPHVVIGRGKPGGAWQYMEQTLKSLSLRSWLDLPIYSFREWQRDNLVADRSCAELTTGDVGTRQPFVGEVAHYYSDYVNKMGLNQNFLSDSEVEKVTSMEKTPTQAKLQSNGTSCSSFSSSPPSLASPSSPANNTSPCSFEGCSLSSAELEHLTDICSVWADSDDCGIHCPLDEKFQKKKACALRWYLRGTQELCSCCRKTRNVCVFSEKLVLASGVTNRIRWLEVPGEDAGFVTHDLPSFIRNISLCDLDSEVFAMSLPIVVVVGAGLSAADAILSALGKGLKVVHVFRQDPNDHKLVFNGIPKLEYPGYGKIFDLMRGRSSHDLYSGRPQSRVVEFVKDNQSVTIVSNGGLREMWKNSLMTGIFIGADANLDYLPDNLVPELTVKKEMPVGSRNPVNVDAINFVSETVPSLYAIGSLTGDSFVRFGIGSAVGAAQHILGLN